MPRIIPAAAAVAAALALVLSLQACGGSKKSESTTPTQSSLAWAGGVCSAISTWKTEVRAAAASAATNRTKAGLTQALDEAKAATSKLGDSIAALKTPQTDATQEAKKIVDDLKGELQNDIAVINRTIQNPASTGGASQAADSITATVKTMRQQASDAADKLRSLPSGELKAAFEQAPACASVTGTTTTGG
jgi:uncharacterized phage infection (PIP) family protein YhgE